MRFIISAAIICFCVVGALAEFERFKELLEICTEKLQADPKAVKAAYDEGKTNDPLVKCVWACTLQEEGSMNAAGEVDKDKMLETIPADASDDIKEKLKEAINECAGERAENECETAYQIFTCIDLKLDSAEE